jgi:hypothetical protein
MDPAASIIAKFGGHEAVATITGKHVTRVYRWTYPKAKGGTNGVIPHEDARKLLAHAKSAGIELQPADFFAEAGAAA